jgi:hypothetical protein
VAIKGIYWKFGSIANLELKMYWQALQKLLQIVPSDLLAYLKCQDFQAEFSG